MSEDHVGEGFDLEAAYPLLAPRLEAVVARRVAAPDAVIEEACQVAWSRLLARQRLVARDSLLPWLVTTATREALKLLNRDRGREPLQDLKGAAVIDLPAPEPGPERLAELHEQLAGIHRLPVRQRQMVWLLGLGYGYKEIAERTGHTARTVERQLLQARRRLGEAA